MGKLKSLEEWRAKYGVDAVHWVDEMADVIRGLQPPCLHVLHGKNTDRCARVCVCACVKQKQTEQFRHTRARSYQQIPTPVRVCVCMCVCVCGGGGRVTGEETRTGVWGGVGFGGGVRGWNRKEGGMHGVGGRLDAGNAGQVVGTRGQQGTPEEYCTC